MDGLHSGLSKLYANLNFIKIISFGKKKNYGKSTNSVCCKKIKLCRN